MVLKTVFDMTQTFSFHLLLGNDAMICARQVCEGGECGLRKRYLMGDI